MEPKSYRFDVVVVGSGMAGLSSAGLLSHAGYKTLVLEKLGYVGGKWSNEVVEGFKLDRGAHMIAGGGPLQQSFNDVGAKYEYVSAPRLWWNVERKDYEMPPKGSIKTLLELANTLEKERAESDGRAAREVPVDAIMQGFRRGIGNPEGELGPTFYDWTLQYTDNETVHDIFDSIAVVAGCRSHEMPTASMFQFFSVGAARAAGKSPRGNSVNAETMADVVKANGGDVWTNCRVKKIIVENGTAKGVVAEKDGKEVDIVCGVVISNIGPKATVPLVGEKNWTDKEYRKLIITRLRPTPAMQFYIGSDRPLWGEPNVKGVCQVCGARRVIGVVPLSSICPELAPPGQHLTFIFAGPKNSLIPMDVGYEIQQCLLDVDELLPGWKRHGRILRISQHDVGDEFPEYRAWPGHGLPPDPKMKNFYLVGDAISATRVGDKLIDTGSVGTAAAGESARVVAEMVKKALPL